MSWPPEALTTARLQLRKPRPADAGVLFSRLCGDPDVTRYLGWVCHRELAETRQQISHDLLRWDRGAVWTWALIAADADDAIGLLQLARQAHVLRLGYLLQHARWGQGLMAEAIAALRERAFAQPWVYRLEALCDVDNHASTRLLDKLGMRCEGRVARALVHPNVSTEPRDAWLYATTRE